MTKARTIWKENIKKNLLRNKGVSNRRFLETRIFYLGCREQDTVTKRKQRRIQWIGHVVRASEF